MPLSEDQEKCPKDFQEGPVRLNLMLNGVKPRQAPRLWIFLLAPAVFWFCCFIIVPLCIVIVYSFSKKGLYGGVELGFSPAQYIRTFDWLYLKIFWNSFKLALTTTVSCLLIGYPMAYVIATARPKWRSLLLILVVIPFWTNFVIRTYAIKLMLSDQGPAHGVIQTLAVIFGTGSEDALIAFRTDLAVWLGMVTNYLPFMVLPLYVSLEKFDFTLLEAAKDLGAKPAQSLVKVLLPLTKPGVITGVLFVFTPALGEFVIPDMLGGAKTFLLGNLLAEQFLKSRDWPFGSAISMVLVVLFMISLMIYLKLEQKTEGGARG